MLRQKGTEPAWSGELLHVEGSGMFTCAGCGAELFPTSTKFDSGSGWPSFTRALADGTDRGARGQVVRHAHAPRSPVPAAAATWATSSPTVRPRPGQRYCVNSLSLEFEPEQAESATASGIAGPTPASAPDRTGRGRMRARRPGGRPTGRPGHPASSSGDGLLEQLEERAQRVRLLEAA